MPNRRATSRDPFPVQTQGDELHWAEGLNRCPKLLFLAHSFPPASQSGSVRTWNIAKYLTRLGWEVVVVTPHPSLWRKIDNPDEIEASLQREGIRRILTGHRWRCLLPDRLACRDRGIGRYAGGLCRRIARLLGTNMGIGWIEAAEHACRVLTASDVDIILASGGPFVAFTIAKRLSQRFGRPYVLDYRDPWTGNPHSSRPVKPAIVRKESRLLAGCAAVTIVSPSWEAALNRRFNLGPKLHVVPNGYDLEGLVETEPYDFGHFAIVYAGLFYPPKRVISPVMAALRRLKEALNGKGPAWYFHYYGSQGDHVSEEARRFDVENCVILHGHVPRPVVLSAVRAAGVALVITSVADDNGSEEQGILPGKLFETLGLGTPILLIAPPGSDAETILTTTKGGRRFSGTDVAGITSFLMDAMLSQAPTPKDREAFAWASIAADLDAILRKAMHST